MNGLKLTLVLALLVGAIGAAIYATSRFTARREAEAGLVTLERRSAETAARIAKLEKELDAGATRVATIEKDNAALRDAVVNAQAAQKSRKKSEPALTRQALDERFRLARTLAKSGDPAQALKEIIWFWDHGLQQTSAGVDTARRSGLASAWRELAERYPEAKTELERRRDALRERIVASPGADLLPEYTSILHALKEEAAVLGLFEVIPPGDRRRTTLSIYAGEQLREARRYAEAMEGASYATMSSAFEMNARMDVVQKVQAPGGFSYFVTSTANNIELLAGSGDVVHARELANRLFAVDKSEATRALVQQKAERAGKPDLLK